MLIIYITLTLISVILCIYSYIKKNIHTGIYIAVFILTIYEWLSLKAQFYDGIHLSDYPISFWIGFFWASILSVILSMIAVLKKKKNNDNS